MNDETKTAFLKAAAVWGGTGLSKWLAAVGVTTWSDFSALCASVVSLLFIVDWVWKKVRGKNGKPKDE